VWTGHTASIRGVVYTDDGRFVVSVSGAIEKSGLRKEDNSIRVWDARRGKQVHNLDGFREALDAVSVSPGGRFAVFGHGGHYEGGKWIDSVDHRVHLWDIQYNKEFYFRKDQGGADRPEARFAGLDSSVFSTAFSPDRKKVVGVANSGKLIVWESQSGQSLLSGQVEAVARQRDDAELLAPISLTLRGINCIRFTPDGRWLLAGGGDYTVRLFDAATGEQLHTFESHQDIVWAVAVTRTRDGRLLGLSGGGRRQRIHGSGFVPGARDYVIRLWDLDSRKEIRRFTGHEGAVHSLVFCPNGRHFLSASSDQTVRLWDIASGKLLRTYRGHTDLVRSVSVSPDGRAAVSGGDDCKIRYWQLPATAKDLILALDKKSWADLESAMRDLDTMGPELRAAYPKLVQTLRQSDKAMAELALTILRRLGQPDKEWVNGLRELLAASAPEVRLFATKALAQLGSDALPALPELRKALSDADRTVRRNAVAALGNIGKDAREADDDLGQLLKQEMNDDIKIEAIKALGKIGCNLSIATLAELILDDASEEVRNWADKLLAERMKHLSEKDVKDVRALLEMTAKPEALRIGLQAVQRLGSKAKGLLPELLNRLPAAEAEQKLEMALALAAIDAKDKKVAETIGPILVGSLRPKTFEEQPREAVLKAIAAIGKPIVPEIFKALKAADDKGWDNAHNRKALFQALQRLGREAYSEDNVKVLRDYSRHELHRDVQKAAGKAIDALLP
jgi:WD40 repeat protein/HEAT repeat protein